MGESQGRIMTGIIRVAPHRGDHRVAARAAVSLAVPLLVLWAIGRLDLSVYASFGAFASLYGRYDGYADRVRMQGAAGATLLVAMLIGTSLAVCVAPTWLKVVVVSLVATGVAVIAHRWSWHPPGGLFAVFAAGACASLPASVSSFLTVLVVGGSAAAFSVLVTSVIALVRHGRLFAPVVRQPRAIDRHSGAVALTVFSGTVLAGLAGLLLVGDHWYWAMVAAVAALGGVHLNARIIRGIQRLVGTLAGVAIAAGLLALDVPPLATIAVAVLLQAGAELYVNRNYGLAMLFVTPLALLMVELAVPAEPVALLADRALDTLVGVLVGTTVAATSAALRRRTSR